jgi:Ser/Thr protein kinase RdoA (MazF antagonist)
VPAHLEDRYGIRVVATTRLDAGVLRVEQRDGPTWVARLFLSGRPLSRTEGDAEVLRFLERRGCPAERCAHPEPVSTLEDRAVLVTEHVEGRAPTKGSAERRQLGDLLGQVHALPAEPGPTERAAGSLHHLPDYEGYPAQDLAAAVALLDDLDGRVPAKYVRVYESLRALLVNGDDTQGLPEAFIHPDPARSNVIATPDGLVLIDWTGAGRGPRLASLAVLLPSVGPKHVKDIVAGYHALRADRRGSGSHRRRTMGQPLWLACWQCWLAVVFSKVQRTFVPDPRRMATIADQARASWGA